MVYSNNTEDFYDVYIDGYYIGRLKKYKHIFKNRFYLNEEILKKCSKTCQIQINCPKSKIKSVVVYKYQYDKKIDEIKCQKVKEVGGRTICFVTIQ